MTNGDTLQGKYVPLKEVWGSRGARGGSVVASCRVYMPFHRYKSGCIMMEGEA